MKPYKPIKVYKWNSENNKTLYVFNNDGSIKDGIDIPDIIYNDDNVEDAINKIGLYIQTIDKTLKFPIYSWTNTKSILFDIETVKWDGYNINPYKSINRKNKDLNEPINYIYKTTQLFNYNHINMIYNNDIIDLKDNKYYFIDKQIPQIEQYRKRDKKMKSLVDNNISNIQLIYTHYHRYDLNYQIKKIKILSEIFENLNTNDNISLIQWINDSSKILYKLHKNHKITIEQLNNWTNLDKISKYKCINLYSILANNTYCKISIDEKGLILFSYILDLRQAINWDNINKSKKKLVKLLEIAIKETIKLKETSIKVNLLFNQDNSNMEILVKKIGEFIDIFQIIKINKDKDKYSINCIYKRTSNYNKQGLDFSKYIKSRLELGITDSEILLELINLNLSKEDAINLIKEQKELDDELIVEKNEFDKNIDTIVIIELYKTGYIINIYNIPNEKELDYLKYWIIRILSLSRDIKKITKTKKPIVIIEEPIEEPIVKSSSKDSSSSSIDLGKLDYDIDFDMSDIKGGALGKEKHSYFVNLLQQADKDLFANNYARQKCQAINQPIVLSKDKLDKLKTDNNFHFDNVIEYGSNPDIKNYYTCPRLWCPQSKIPLNPDETNPKCPIENEEPMELFFDNDKNKKRYVKLIKPDDNGICVPCCFKKEPKEEELNKCKYYNNEKIKSDKLNKPEKSEETSEPLIKAENYIMNQSAPINVGRYGVIPQILHELLFPNVEFSLCSKILNRTDKCFVRIGINHKNNKNKIKYITNDSIINAISSSLNFNSKDLFIKDIKNKLDLITFMSLENGEICKVFMDELPIIPENNIKLCKDLKLFLEKFEITKKLFNLDNINYNKPTYNLSRLLSIYKSYIKYIDYLNSDNFPTNKSPYYLYSLLSILYNILLVIWEKTEKDLNIVCPYYSCFEDIIASMNLNPNVLMLLKDNKFYEPIELKIRGQDGEKLIKLNEYPNIKKLISQCSILKKSFDVNNKIYNNIYTLHQWTKTNILKNSKKFIINTVVINNDLTIDRLITIGNIFIIINPINISFLPTLIKNLDITKIIFYDDIIDTKLKINILTSDLNIFVLKIKSLNINFDLGKLNDGIKEDAVEYYTTLTIPKRNLNNNIIHVRLNDDIYKSSSNLNNSSKKWFQLQQYVASILINKLNDNKIKELLTINKKDRINNLLKLFSTNPNIKKIRIILEELPLFSINHIRSYINNIIYYNKYHIKYNNNIIIENNKEFIFSQLSLLNGIPPKLLLFHKSTPSYDLNKFVSEDYIINNKIIDSVEDLPSIFIGSDEKLKTKWIMHKKSKWTNMTIIKCSNYNINTIPEFYNWLSNFLSITTTYDEVKKVSNIKLAEILENKVGMFEILSDPSYFNEWNRLIKKKFKTIQLFWDNYYTEKTPAEHLDILKIIITNNNLYTNDINILSISELLNINILIIHRGKYGKFKNDLVRGDIDDLILSSTFFKAPNIMEDRPLIILNKTDDTIKSIYNIIIETTDKITSNSIFMQYKDTPLNIKYLVEAHLKL